MSVHSNNPYNYSFDPEGDSTAAKVIRMVGKNKRVLELGCAYGVMTKVLAEQNACRVFGIEIDGEAAAQARPYCEKLVITDLDSIDWNDLFAGEKFDVILAADVLEHLRDPRRHLIEMAKRLAPGGYITLSIPNVAHNGIVAELLADDFGYRQTGLLDRTHIHFFALKSLVRTLEGAGLWIVDLQKTNISAGDSEFADAWKRLPRWLVLALESRNFGNVYQYIVKVKPIVDKAGSQKRVSFVDEPALAADVLSQISAERDSVVAERDSMRAERDSVVAERDSMRAERDTAVAHIEAIRNSRSWRITRPLRLVARILARGLRRDDREKISQVLRTAYHRLPLPSPAKKTLSWFYHRALGKFYRAMRARLRATTFKPPSIKPALPRADVPDYVVWSVIDWHFRLQRPQQLARALTALGRRVFFISPSFIDDERGGFDVEPLDADGRLFQIKLYAKGAPVIYSSIPGLGTVSQLRMSMGEVLGWADSAEVISLVQHPFWHGIASVLPNNKLIYDCMDHHEGFSNTAVEVLSLEPALLRDADLTVTTSDLLDRIVAEHTPRRALIRNASDYGHFAQRPTTVYRDPEGRRVIGYYGAIADWFDQELVEKVAKRFPDCCVLLIGADTAGAVSRLGRLPNVKFIGEVPYATLPTYLHAFDVCLMPFKVVPLTLATNPVKVYEYLSAGKPVVAVDLPEMKQFGDLVQVGGNADAFVSAVAEVLKKPENAAEIARRQTFAKEQTWTHRVEALVAHAEMADSDPKVSIVVVTYNNLDFTRACLESLDVHSHYYAREIIVVDNASADGTKEFLSGWVTAAPNRKLILNDDNRGFAAANNQGLAIADGEYLVLLNNDTYVTPGWVRTLVAHLRRDNTLGLVGPVTNNIGNEAKISIAYENMEQMLETSAHYTRRHIGKTFPLRTAAFFCVMMSRDTYKRVGALDEAFGRGFFEDDDYCRRVEQLGLRIICAEDVFIHHHLSASFNKMMSHERKALFEQNRAVYEAKWGKWVPHVSIRKAGSS